MLIVDDEPDICDCLQTFFSTRGFSVSLASNGKQALDLLLDSPPQDVILLDINLPDCSGIDLLRQAKDLQPDAQIIMVTALNRADLRTEATCYGARGYVVKPFDFSELTWAPVFAACP